jgi:hypothetical protein
MEFLMDFEKPHRIVLNHSNYFLCKRKGLNVMAKL